MRRISIKERILALLVALVLTFSGAIPVPAETVQAAPGDVYTVDFQLENKAGDFSVKVTGNSVNKTLTAEKDDEKTESTYVDHGYKYEYTVTKTGYEEYKGEFTLVDGSETIVIPLASEDNTDGMKMEPIELNKTSVSLTAGTSESITIGNKITGMDYTWKSANEKIATVKDGKITAVGYDGNKNETTITVTGPDKMTKETVNVKVSKATTKVTIKATPDSSNDASSVECVAQIGAEDATGEVIFLADGKEFARKDVKNGKATATYKETESNQIIGGIVFEVRYSGDNKYNDAKDSTNGTYTKTTPLEFKDNKDKTVIREDAEEKTFDIEVEDTNVANRTLKFESSNTSVATVDEDGKVTIAAPGKAEITVTAKAEGNYVESEKTYEVIVQNVISAEEINWNAVSKIYDGKVDINITGSLKAEDVTTVDGVSNVTVEYESVVDDVNVGTEKEVTLGAFVKVTDDNSEDVKEYFVFEIDGDKVEGKASITKRTVYLATKDVEGIAYDADVKAEIEAMTALVYEDTSLNTKDTGLVNDDEVEINKATVADIVYEPDTVHSNVIKPVISEVDGSNYNYVETTVENNLGDLKLDKASLGNRIFDIFTWSSDTNTHYQDSEEDKTSIWFQNGKLFAQITDGGKTLYDSVVFETGNGKYDLSKDGYVVEEGTETQPFSGDIYLQKDGKRVTDKVSFTIKIDDTDPTAVFGEWTETPAVVDTLLNAIKFDKYAKSTYSVNPEVKDADSGLSKWYYHVYKVEETEDKTIDEQLTGEALTEYSKAISWEEGTEEAISVLKGIANSSSEYQGYYVVLVKAVDNVNNSVTYASNGVVIENEEPVIEIKLADGREIEADKFYTEDIEYMVEITDPQKTTSAISEVKIELINTKTEEIYKTISRNILTDTQKAYSAKELKEFSTATINDKDTIVPIKVAEDGRVIPIIIKDDETVVPVEINSNFLAIKVTATDKAGNKSESTQNLMVDNVIPEIEVEYKSDAEVKNGKYFNKDRVMQISYIEKNFFVDGLSFNLEINGISQGDELTYQQLKERSSEYGIEVGEIVDNQNGDYTDARINTLDITFKGIEEKKGFGEQAEYKLIPRIKDGAQVSNDGIKYADTNSECNEVFVIDKGNPRVNIVYINSENIDVTSQIDGATDDNRYYSNPDITATVSVEEQNFSFEDKFSDEPKQNVVDLKGVDYSGTEVEVEDHQSYVDVFGKEGNWTQNGNIYTTNLLFATDANYTFGYSYTDLAGNECIYVVNGVEQDAEYDYARYFTVDKTDPTGTIKLDGAEGLWQKIENVISFIFNWFKKDTYEVSLTSEDITAGIDTISYYTTPEVVEGDLANLDWKVTEDNKVSFTKDADEQFFVYGRVIDKAGNTIYLSTTDGAVVENNVPEISVKETSSPVNGKGIYDRAIPLEINVSDVDGDSVKDAGIEKIWYEITADVNGNVVKEEGTLYDKKSDSIDGTKINIGQGEVKVICNLEVPTKFNSNNIHVKVNVMDVAGNKNDTSIDLAMDTTNPKANIDPALVKGYFNETVGTTIKVTERNFDESNVHLSITNTDKKPAYVGSWNIDDAGKYDSALNTCNVEFREDGDYVMNFYCVDKAGRKSNEYTSPVVTIDKTKPVIKVTYNNNNAENGNYYDAPRTATVTITEHNFDAKDVKFDTNGKVGGWKSAGDIHTATVSFNSDNDYYFDVDYTDLAGNVAADYARDEFTVDLTKPTVEISGVGDRSANKGTVAPVITIKDTNFDPNRVEITLTGTNKGKIDIGSLASVSTTADGRVIRFKNFPENMDDIYTLTAKAVDKAGNETTKTILFSVNRDGSTYKVNKYTKELIDKGYTNDPQDIVIVETNVDTLTFVELSYTKDGKIVVLEKGKDYNVKVTGGETSWKQYTYTIFASAFEEEGKYNINISSVDRAKNESNNKVQSMTVEFIVDKTVPTLAISNLENRGRYDTNTHQFIVNVKDNTALSKVEIYMENDKGELVLVETRKGEDLVVENGKLYVDVNAKDGFQSVMIKVYDEAGNTVESDEYSILVTENKLLLFYANKPLFFGTIIGVIALIGLIIFIVAKRRKDDEEEAK